MVAAIKINQKTQTIHEKVSLIYKILTIIYALNGAEQNIYIHKIFGDELGFEIIQFPFKIREKPKTEKKNGIRISVFRYESKAKICILCVKKYFQEKLVDLLMIEEKGKSYYVLIKNFNTFICNHTLNL